MFARLVADNLGFGLTVGNGFLDDNWKKGHIFPNLAAIPYNEKQTLKLDADISKNHAPNFTTFVSNRKARSLHLAGFPFNDMTPFWDHREQIRKSILAIDLACVYWNISTWPGPRDVVIHLRAYEGKCEKVFREPRSNFDPRAKFVNPPYAYYDRILKRMKKRGPVGTVWLASRCREIDTVALKLMKEHNARFVPATAVRQDVTEWLWMVAASRLVIAQSTFSWWAAFLGEASEVHFPLVGEWWGKRPRFRLYPNDKRYVYHDLCVFHSPVHMNFLQWPLSNLLSRRRVNEKWYMSYSDVANTKMKNTW